MPKYKPELLLEYYRDGLVEQEHYGFLIKLNSNNETTEIGKSNNYPFFLRSCAKPLQAALLFDLGLDEKLKLTSEEIAICCASHTGEPCHTNAVKNLLNKSQLNDTQLKCGIHKPLSKTEQSKLIISGTKESILQNNCSGKHSMMLTICKHQGWNLSDYDEITHPLQVAIKSKIYELCEINTDYPVTKDGCGVPIYSMPLTNMLKGYMNLLFDKKYEKLKNAIIENPYLIGGEGRLDTAIMTANSKLIAKVGAGGLCIVINLETKEGIIIKIMDCDMKARALCLIEALKQLNWLNYQILESDLIKAQYKTEISTLHNETVGFAKFNFNI